MSDNSFFTNTDSLVTNEGGAPGMGVQTVVHDAEITIPPSVAVCPKCGEPLTLEIDEWEELDDGTWAASECGTHIDCSSDPDIDYRAWFEVRRLALLGQAVEAMPVHTTLQHIDVTQWRYIDVDGNAICAETAAGALESA